jgi:DNA mismatch repair protein MSH4
LIQIPKTKAQKFAEQSINRMIQLKHILRQTQQIASLLENVQSRLLIDILKVVNSVEIETVLDQIDVVINEDIVLQKSSLGLRNQKSSAVKSGFNGLLDVARQTYKEATEDVHELVQGYVETYGLNIKTLFSAGSGYYLSITLDQLGDKNLPLEFINITRKKTQITFVSLKLVLDINIAKSKRKN